MTLLQEPALYLKRHLLNRKVLSRQSKTFSNFTYFVDLIPLYLLQINFDQENQIIPMLRKVMILKSKFSLPEIPTVLTFSSSFLDVVFAGNCKLCDVDFPV